MNTDHRSSTSIRSIWEWVYKVKNHRNWHMHVLVRWKRAKFNPLLGCKERICCESIEKIRRSECKINDSHGGEWTTLDGVEVCKLKVLRRDCMRRSSKCVKWPPPENCWRLRANSHQIHQVFEEKEKESFDMKRSPLMEGFGYFNELHDHIVDTKRTRKEREKWMKRNAWVKWIIK